MLGVRFAEQSKSASITMQTCKHACMLVLQCYIKILASIYVKNVCIYIYIDIDKDKDIDVDSMK